MKKSLVLQFPNGAQAAQAQPLASATSHDCHKPDTEHVRDEKSFQRYLEAANNLGSHLTNIFDDAFLKALSPARGAGAHTGAEARAVGPIQILSRKTKTVEPLPDYRI
jgi:hypothetical protein